MQRRSSQPCRWVRRARRINPGKGHNTCDLNIFTNVTVTKCVGFYDKNANKGDTGDAISGDMLNALQLLLGGSPTGTIVEKIDYGKNDVAGDFNTTLYGLTVVGYHWGGGNDAAKNGSAFYLFDAGSEGVTSLGMVAGMHKALSNGVVLYTGTPSIPGVVVPEPSTYLLMLAGLGGIGLAVRRRRDNA